MGSAPGWSFQHTAWIRSPGAWLSDAERGEVRCCFSPIEWHCDRHPRCFKRPLYDARSVRIVGASPVLLDTVLLVCHTSAFAVGSGHASHLPGRSLSSSELG